MMWASVKGKTENDLAKLPFKAEYNFQAGCHVAFCRIRKTGSRIIKFLVKIIKAISPKNVLTMQEVGRQ